MSFTHFLRRAVLALCASFPGTLALAGEAEQPPIPAPSPAFWKLDTDNGTMYFLGSMHVLPLGFRWRTPIIERAMEASDVFVFEVSMGGGSIRDGMAHISGDLRLPKGETLSGKLSEQGKKDLEAITKELGINLKALDRFRPWAALQIISEMAAKTQKNGILAAAYGVDQRVAQFSEQKRKPRRYFETAEFQMNMMTRIDEDGMGSFEAKLREVLKTRIALTMRRMAELYVTGQLDTLMKELNDPSESPKFQKLLLEDRNKRWVEEIPTMLKQKRTFFVTVGAAHMVGDKSVITLLCAKGFAPQRIDSVSGRAQPACPAKIRTPQAALATPKAARDL